MNTLQPKTLKDFLLSNVTDEMHRDCATYIEDVNDDALTDAWLESKTSYIWKVGVLAVIDPNKCDWVYLYIGHQRKPTALFEFIGVLHWSDGENDDIGRCLHRYISIAGLIHPVFGD